MGFSLIEVRMKDAVVTTEWIYRQNRLKNGQAGPFCRNAVRFTINSFKLVLFFISIQTT